MNFWKVLGLANSKDVEGISRKVDNLERLLKKVYENSEIIKSNNKNLEECIKSSLDIIEVRFNEVDEKQEQRAYNVLKSIQTKEEGQIILAGIVSANSSIQNTAKVITESINEKSDATKDVLISINNTIKELDYNLENNLGKTKEIHNLIKENNDIIARSEDIEKVNKKIDNLMNETKNVVQKENEKIINIINDDLEEIEKKIAILCSNKEIKALRKDMKQQYDMLLNNVNSIPNIYKKLEILENIKIIIEKIDINNQKVKEVDKEILIIDKMIRALWINDIASAIETKAK